MHIQTVEKKPHASLYTCQSACCGWADGNFLAEFLLTKFICLLLYQFAHQRQKKYIVFSPLSPLRCFMKKDFLLKTFEMIPIISPNSVGLDSVKERYLESKADKNQIKDCRLKREEKTKSPHPVMVVIAVFSFS